jgi:hypothetical protein
MLASRELLGRDEGSWTRAYHCVYLLYIILLILDALMPLGFLDANDRTRNQEWIWIEVEVSTRGLLD